MARELVILLLVAIVSARRRQTPDRCNTADISQFGGNSAAMISSFERCLPEVVTESNMDVVEGCAITVFAPDNITERCKKCGLTFLDQNELNLKLCFVKCSGIAKSANPCLKCKEEIEQEWDTACFSNAIAPQQEAYDNKGVFSVSSISLLLLTTLLLVV